MGWFWGKEDGSAPAAAKQQTSSSNLKHDEARPNPSPIPSQPPTSDKKTNARSSRESDAEMELASWIQEMVKTPQYQDPASSKQKPLPPSSTTTPEPPTSLSAGKVSAAHLDPSSPTFSPALAAIPSEMSCRTVFDTAYHCQSLGGQFLGVYRYGGLRECSPLWSQFWFCMRTNHGGGHSEEEKERRIRAWYVNREREWLKESPAGQMRSSEDVWKSRGAGEGVGDTSFSGDFDKLFKGFETQFGSDWRLQALKENERLRKESEVKDKPIADCKMCVKGETVRKPDQNLDI